MDSQMTYQENKGEVPQHVSSQGMSEPGLHASNPASGTVVRITSSSLSQAVPRPSPEFVKRFERKYGRGAIATFIKIIEKVSSNLSDVARTFGFTREYARHIYKKIYGVSYSDMRQVKLRLRREQRIVEDHRQGKNRLYLREIGELIRSAGLEYELKKKARFYFHLSNGKTIGVRRCRSPLRIGNVYYYRFNNFAWAPDEFDFLVLRCEGKKKATHYVIPHQFMPRRIVSLNPDSVRAGSKYARFKEAWHLLHTELEQSQAVG